MIKRVFVFVFAVMTVLGARAQWSVKVMAGYDYNSYDYAKGGMLTTCVMRGEAVSQCLFRCNMPCH